MVQPPAAFMNVFSDSTRLPIRRNTNDWSLVITSLFSCTVLQSSMSTSAMPAVSCNAFVSSVTWPTRPMVTARRPESTFFTNSPCRCTAISANPDTLNDRSEVHSANVRPGTVSLPRPSPHSSTATSHLL